MSMTRRDAATAVGAALAVGLVFRSGTAEARCPNIEGGVSALKLAKAELNQAAHDFNGHRADALKAIDAALTQLGLCLQHPQCK
jgi:hypothetical protein